MRVTSTGASYMPPEASVANAVAISYGVTSYDPSGVQIGTFKTSSFDRTVFADGGQDSTFSVSRYQGSGPYESCHGGYLLKIVDYEVQVEHFSGPHCS